MDHRLDAATRGIQRCAEAERAGHAAADAVLASCDGRRGRDRGRYGIELDRERVALVPYGLPDADGADAGAPRTARQCCSSAGSNTARASTRCWPAVPGVLDRFPTATATIVGDDSPRPEDGRTYRQRFEPSTSGGPTARAGCASGTR